MKTRKIESGCWAIVRGIRPVQLVRVKQQYTIPGYRAWLCDDGSEYLASELKRVSDDEAEKIEALAELDWLTSLE